VVDESGSTVKLGDLFDGKKPVIFTLVYYTCPNLCTEELNHLVASLKDPNMTLQFGTDYSIVTLSFGEKDTPGLARAKKVNYLRALGQTSRDYSWHFLTGQPDQVRRIADAVGFGYVKNFANGEYLHGSAIFICTPQGRVSRTIPDTFYPALELRDSLVYASQGHIGSPILRAARICGLVAFNPATGRYTPVAMGLMRAAGVVMVLFMSGLILVYWWRDRHRQAGIKPA